MTDNTETLATKNVVENVTENIVENVAEQIKEKKSTKDKTFWERNRLSEGYLLKKKIVSVFLKVCRAILLFGMCFLILQPLLNKISVSFMEEQDLYNPVVISIPEHFTFANYQTAYEVMEYGKAFKNSLILAITIAIVQILVCTLVGYGFARFNFPLKKLWFAFVMMIIIVPPQTISSSLHLHFKFFDIFGIINAVSGSPLTLLGNPVCYYLLSIGCMGLKNGLYIYMIRQYFRNIPYDLEEAAYIDGCGTLKTFFKIMLPQAKPIITSCFLFALVWQWTDGFYAKYFMSNTQLVSYNLAKIVDSLGVFIARKMGLPGQGATAISIAYSNCILGTGTLMIVMPMVILYMFAQRQFVESISSTGIKM